MYPGVNDYLMTAEYTKNDAHDCGGTKENGEGAVAERVNSVDALDRYMATITDQEILRTAVASVAKKQ